MPNCASCGDKLGLICCFFLFGFGLIGLAFSFLAIAACDFFEFENNLEADWLPVGSNGQIGLFRGQASLEKECATYPDNANFDGWAITARAASLLAPIFCILALCLVTCECVCCKFCGSKFLLSFCFFLAWASQGLSFCLFGTERFCNDDATKCSLGKGGIYSIVATSVWLVTSCVVCCSPKPEPLIKRKCGKGGCRICCCKKKDYHDVEKGNKTDSD